MKFYKMYPTIEEYIFQHRNKRMNQKRPYIMDLESAKGESVIRMVCMNCKKPLDQYEINNGLAFCFNCRSTLFPTQETKQKCESHELMNAPCKTTNNFFYIVNNYYGLSPHKRWGNTGSFRKYKSDKPRRYKWKNRKSGEKKFPRRFKPNLF